MYHSFIKTTILSYTLLASTMVVARTSPEQLGQETAHTFVKYAALHASKGNTQPQKSQLKNLLKQAYKLKPHDRTTYLREIINTLESINESSFTPYCPRQPRQIVSAAKYFVIEILEKLIHSGKHLNWKITFPVRLPFTRKEAIEALAKAIKKSPECIEVHMLSQQELYNIAEQALSEAPFTQYLK